MTIIFRQRTFSKRWKIQKDWDVRETILQQLLLLTRNAMSLDLIRK